MRPIISFIMLCFIFIGPLYAQEWVIDENWGIAESTNLEQIFESSDASSLLKKQDKPIVTLLRSMVTDSKGYTQNFVQLSKTTKITFWGEFTAMFNTRVRFHYTWTGPEFRTYTTDWRDAEAHQLQWVSVVTDTKWEKGTYKWVIIAEQKNLGSGAECVVDCVFRLY